MILRCDPSTLLHPSRLAHHPCPLVWRPVQAWGAVASREPVSIPDAWMLPLDSGTGRVTPLCSTHWGGLRSPGTRESGPSTGPRPAPLQVSLCSRSSSKSVPPAGRQLPRVVSWAAGHIVLLMYYSSQPLLYWLLNACSSQPVRASAESQAQTHDPRGLHLHYRLAFLGPRLLCSSSPTTDPAGTSSRHHSHGGGGPAPLFVFFPTPERGGQCVPARSLED